MSNLADAKTHKLSDRRQILLRILGQLLLDRDCRYFLSCGNWRPLTADQQANWDARSTIQTCLQDFPSPLPIDLPLETLSTEEQTGSPDGNLAHAPDEVVES
jgi:hypothetical protein